MTICRCRTDLPGSKSRGALDIYAAIGQQLAGARA
jgi:hypothetical protein